MTGARSEGGEDLTWSVGAGPVLFAVADGMGGALLGTRASRLAVSTLHSELTAAIAHDPGLAAPDRLIASALGQANAAVTRECTVGSREWGAATLCCVLVTSREAWVALAGVCDVLLVSGATICEVVRPIGTSMLLMDGVPPVRGSYIRLLMLGGGKNDEPIIARVELREGDTFVLCSDGLRLKVADEEILNAIRQESSFSSALNRLLALANERGGEDNTTCIIAQVTSDALPPSPEGEPLEARRRIVSYPEAYVREMVFAHLSWNVDGARQMAESLPDPEATARLLSEIDARLAHRSQEP